jgi:hypothetical protein
MKTLEEVFCIYLSVMHLLDMDLEEGVLIKNELPVNSISNHSIKFVVH